MLFVIFYSVTQGNLKLEIRLRMCGKACELEVVIVSFLSK